MENEKKIKEIDTDFLEEDARKRFFGQGGVDELIDLLDDEDETEYKKWENLRDIASDKYDFTGFDHVNCYDKKNFLAGTLEALERTRRRLSISTAEKLIDFLFVFGYSLKRIIYILYCQGYVDWFGRDVQNYINRNRFRLNKERQELIDQMNDEIKGVFQQMKASVMKAEERALNKYLSDIKEIQDELINVSPVKEPAKYGRFTSQLEKLLEKVKKMHGIEALRDASIDISKDRAKLHSRRAVELGLLDDVIKENNQSSRDVTSSATITETQVHVIE